MLMRSCHAEAFKEKARTQTERYKKKGKNEMKKHIFITQD
jgi:hypothetical protein